MKILVACVIAALALGSIVWVISTRQHEQRIAQELTEENATAGLPEYRGIVLGPEALSAALDEGQAGALMGQIAAVNANWIEVRDYLPASGGFDAQRVGMLADAAHEHGIDICLVLCLPGAQRQALPTEEAAQEDWVRHVWGPRVLAVAGAAAAMHIDLLCIGDRLAGVEERTAAWEELIGKVRKADHGPLTYAADAKDYSYVIWWPKLDYIGVVGDFSLSDEANPTAHILRLGWKANLESLESTHRYDDKPVVLLDVGFSVNPQVAMDSTLADGSGVLRPDIQALCYQTALERTKGKEWLAGVFMKTWPVGEGRVEDDLAHTPALHGLLEREWGVGNSRITNDK